ncbi:minor capsid protein [Lactiplantibacillus plantarum]
MERKAVLQLAQRVYGENDKRVKRLNELFKHANNEIVDVLSTFIADEVNWSAPAPKAQIQELMDDIAKLAVSAAIDERPFVNQTFRDERVKTYGDVAKQRVNLIVTQLAIDQKQVIQSNLNHIDRAPLVNLQPDRAVYSRHKSDIAVQKIVGDNHRGWQGASWQDRIYKEKSALMRQLDNQVDDVLKNHYKPQDFSKEIATKLGASEGRAERILRTESSGELSRQLIDDFGQRSVKRYQIEAALSVTTCEECEALDGTEYNIEEASEGVTLPPFHPDCQCTIIEVADNDYSVDFSQMPKNYGLD